MNLNKCDLPARSTINVGNSPVRKKALSLPKTGNFDMVRTRFDKMSNVIDERVFRSGSVSRPDAGGPQSTLY